MKMKRCLTILLTRSTIKTKNHVDIQAAAQKWIDSSISKTINVPTDYDFEDFKEIYMYAYEKGLKGCTTFRFNPEAFPGRSCDRKRFRKYEVSIQVR